MTKPVRFVITVALLLASFGLLYWRVIAKLVFDWSHDENYSHGFLIVPIALYFVWERRARLSAATSRPRALGLAVVLASVALLAAGILGAELFLTRISMLGVTAGTILFLLGWQHLAILAFPLAFLLLMIPIPAIVFNQIAFPLQLLASRFGEAALTVVGIPVLREGNVITLATTSLEVAEACSGIRSLISLLTLAIVYGYLAESRIWVRVVLALSAIPVAIVANGVRVAGTGVAAHYLGLEAAMGFFHTFSGWLVFLVAFALLFVVHRVVLLVAPVRMAGRGPATEAIKPTPSSQSAGHQVPSADSPVIRSVLVSLCLITGAVLIGRASTTEPRPPRVPFSTFPMQIGVWRGENAPRFDQQILTVLGVDEYVNRTYVAPGGLPVGLYIGYYQSQRQGDTIHSPLNCMPGSGWEPAVRERARLTVPEAGGTRQIEVNRIVIEKGLDKQVVLYWYQSHGRVVASEYWGKVYTVLDAIRLNRTDAAMIRLISPVSVSEGGVAPAAGRVTALATAMYPLLDRYLPQ
jgi:exosortase D (VPLPA-CTERM-specific)